MPFFHGGVGIKVEEGARFFLAGRYLCKIKVPYHEMQSVEFSFLILRKCQLT